MEKKTRNSRPKSKLDAIGLPVLIERLNSEGVTPVARELKMTRGAIWNYLCKNGVRRMYVLDTENVA